MFAWICPQCGREVPPSEAECPYCAGQPALKQPARTQEAPPARRRRLPAWLLTLIFAAGFAALGGAAYWGYRSVRARPAAAPARAGLTLESPGTAAITKPHPLARHIEICGLRLSEDSRQRATIQFLVVNHSGADLSGLAAEVKLVAVTPKGEREAVGSFSFRAPLLGPYQAREFKAPLLTQLRVYELPDWQFLKAEFEITAPAP